VKEAVNCTALRSKLLIDILLVHGMQGR